MTPLFGITDYCLLAAMLAVSAAIGIFMSLKGNKSPEDYLLGNRSFNPIPVSMSLLTSMVSAISLLGYSGEVYAHGLQFSVTVAGATLAILFCYFFIVPVLFPLKLTSINEYIEMRFKSKLLRSFLLFWCSVNGFIYSGVCLYAPTIALATVTPFSTTTYIYLLGTVCTLYSAIGGIKAVVWTDVFQLTVVVIGLAVTTILGCVNQGGIMNVWKISNEGGRFDMLRMNFGLYGGYTLPNMFLFGFFYWIGIYGTSQINAQRINCVKTIKEAKFVMLSNMVGFIIIYFLIFTSGILCYASYAGCDPVALKKITKSDEILTFFVLDKLGYITGLPGLFVATIVGGALSSVSSVISAQVSMMWKDCLSHLRILENVTPQVAAIINKVLSFLVGAVVIGMALWSSQSESIVDFLMVIASGLFGSILGIYLLGFFFPTCNAKGVWCGWLISMAFMSWITVGGMMYRPPRIPLPVSIENCTEITNSTSEELSRSSYVMITESSINNATSFNETFNQGFEFHLMWLYGISPTLYAVIAPVMCIVFGLIASFATGSQSLSELSPKLITPVVRKFCWTEDELIHSEKEQKSNGEYRNCINKREA